MPLRGSAASFTGARPTSSVAAWLCAAVVAVGVTVALGKAAIALGPQSAHMVVHVLMMNAVAPALAAALLARNPEIFRACAAGRALVFSGVVQMALLWTWHAPGVVAVGYSKTSWMHSLMVAALLAASLSFWLSVLSEEGAGRWRAVVAILLTGKIFCLLGALLLFAPRLLYPAAAGHGMHGHSASLADQQMAAMIMLAACPTVYVSAGVAIAARWLRDLDSDARRHPPGGGIPASFT